MTQDKGKLPLDGIRVIDFGQIYSVPLIGGLLGDLGAEIIKVEAPMRADTRRVQDGAYQGTFQVLNRGKKCISVDLSKPEGVELIKKLVAVSDIVIENFTPRVMPNFGLQHSELVKINPRIIMLSNCGYGSTGPWGPFPIQGTSLEGTMGIVYYTGYEDSPSKAGQSYPDFIAAWTGLGAILAALNHVDKTGEGQWIDQSMYQIGVSIIPEGILKYQIDGQDYERIGNHDRWKAPANVYRTGGDDEWLVLSVDSDAHWQTLAQIMGRPELGSDPRFATVTERLHHQDELDEIVGVWAATQDRIEAMKLLQSHGIAAGAVFHAAELMYNEEMLHRQFYEPVEYPDIGVRPLIGRPYRTRNSAPRIKGPAPEFADANDYVLQDILQLPPSEIDALYDAGVVVREPVVSRGGGGGGFNPAGWSKVQIDEHYIEKLRAVYGDAVREPPVSAEAPAV